MKSLVTVLLAVLEITAFAEYPSGGTTPYADTTVATPAYTPPYTPAYPTEPPETAVPYTPYDIAMPDVDASVPPPTAIPTLPLPDADVPPVSLPSPGEMSSCSVIVRQEVPTGFYWNKPYIADVHFMSTLALVPRLQLTLIRDSSGSSNSVNYSPAGYPYSVTSPPLPPAPDGLPYGLTLQASLTHPDSGTELARCETRFTVSSPAEQPGTCSVLVFQEENSSLIRWGKPYRVRALLDAPGRIADRLVLSLSTGFSSTDSTYPNPPNPLITAPSPNGISASASGDSYEMEMAARYYKGDDLIAECFHHFDAKKVPGVEGYISVAQVNRLVAEAENRLSDPILRDKLFTMFRNRANGGDGAEDALEADSAAQSGTAALLEAMLDQLLASLEGGPGLPAFDIDVYYPNDVVVDAAVTAAKNLVCSYAGQIPNNGLKRACWGDGFCATRGILRRPFCRMLIPISQSIFHSTVYGAVAPAIRAGVTKLNTKIADVLRDFAIDGSVTLVPSSAYAIQQKYQGGDVGFRIISGQDFSLLHSFACGVPLPTLDGSFAQCVFNNLEPYGIDIGF